MPRRRSDARARKLGLLALAILGCAAPARATAEAASATVAQAIAARVGTVPGLGKASARGSEIVFSSSKLSLDVSEQETTSKGAHFATAILLSRRYDSFSCKF